jgi:hypothetical protein
MNAVESKIIHYLFECIQNLPHSDEVSLSLNEILLTSRSLDLSVPLLLQRVPAVIDVLIEIWASSEAKIFFMKKASENEDICISGVPFYVDEFLELIQQLQLSRQVSTEKEILSQLSKETQSQSCMSPLLSLSLSVLSLSVSLCLSVSASVSPIHLSFSVSVWWPFSFPTSAAGLCAV